VAVLDSTGLQIPTVEEILAELTAEQRTTILATLNTSADSLMGEINGIFAAKIREAWEALQVAYHGFDPDAVEGFLLDKLCAITGTVRDSATFGTVEMSVVLTIGTTLISGTHFASVFDEPSNRWTPVADFTAPATGAHAVAFRAETVGNHPANALTITTIATPVFGWSDASNLLDADAGREADTDLQLSVRREEELRAAGSATVDAIRADLLDREEILQCRVFENPTDFVDADGLPPHSFEALVHDEGVLADDVIAQIVWDTKPAGIATHGAVLAEATDSLGNAHEVRFTRPTEREVWIVATPFADSGVYAISDLPALNVAIQEEIVALNESELLAGRDVIAARINEVIMSHPGIFDLFSTTKLGFAPVPVGTTNLVITSREIARLDTSRTSVVSALGPRP
jgi:uncharacterized phage protein gp47/JayE